MGFQVIYCSKTGHTRRVAEAIASEMGVKAEDVKGAKLKKDALVFLGSGSYGSKPGEDMSKFIEDNDFGSRSVALFGTSGSGQGAEVKEMENALSAKGACIKGKFFCKGKILLINLGRPNDKDIDDAKKFAKNMIE